ncbi:MAG TPA: malto-oligosyltrehalose synthase, partial [Longimicrobiales bacterium]|nr:malto-oligosyltrehalose synthase [Longimicrobiales bacterium]
RFFDIGDLISVRAEDPAVFDAMHALILRLVRERRITGLRIDHVDGLYDPEAYLRKLIERLGARRDEPPPCYLVVEKILAPDESLPREWPVHGTTGYDFVNALNGLFVHAEGLARIRRDYARFTGETRSFDALRFAAKRKVIRELFAGDVRSLEWRLIRLARQDRHGRDIPGQELAAAIAAVSAGLAVYRTYIRSGTVTDADRARIREAIAVARRQCPTIDPAALDFLERVLLLELSPNAPPGRRRAWLAFVQRWQQFTGPVTAKGIEDTVLYRYNPLTSLNEVGGDPGAGTVSVAEFHRRMAGRLTGWPASLSATTTHDTKRAEAVRARINVLSEIPGTWQRQLRDWVRRNAALKPTIDGRPVPDANEELLLYQTLLGVWPLDAAELPELLPRLEGFVIKAAREAKVHTGWIAPDSAYEDALLTFLRRILEAESQNRFLERFTAFLQRIAPYGAQNALSQTLIKAAAPGVPDIYQGTELWSFILVDPDNRRPVDFDRRIAALEALDARTDDDGVALARSLLENWRDGRIHLYLAARLLRFRRAKPSLFGDGEYLPLETRGRWRENVCAFARHHAGEWAIAVAPRLLTRVVPPGRFAIGSAWGRTHLRLPVDAPRTWRDVVTGAAVNAVRRHRQPLLPLARALEHLPVALLAAGE